jgi:CIC family chloride channel protein
MNRLLALRMLRLRLWLAERFRPDETLVTYFWAGVVGLVAGFSGRAFLLACDGLQFLFTGNHKNLAAAAEDLPDWRRVMVPALGGLLAGLVLWWGQRATRNQRATEYMEAVALGDGVIRTAPALTRIGSSIFSISSGGSIGREGPMAQLASLLASRLGRLAHFPRPRLRLMVACGAAASMASAYNAPIGGALFVAEVVLGSIAMASFGPLLFSSFAATVVVRALTGGRTLFEVPHFQLVSYPELGLYLALGLLCGAAVPLFLGLLDVAKSLFARIPLPLPLLLMLGGVIVGVISVWHPIVWGNGYGALSQVLTVQWTASALAVLILFKLLATAATVGSGAVGGIFTPMLLVGGVLGGLVGCFVQAFAGASAAPPQAYALVGMGAFLAAATQAPFMAILMVFDMTLNHEIVLPLMLACVAAHLVAQSLRGKGVYQLARKARDLSDSALDPLHDLRVRDLMRYDPPSVSIFAPFQEVVDAFARHRNSNLYVVDEGEVFRGVIPLHDIKGQLGNPELAARTRTEDVVVAEFPTINPEATLHEALEKFRNLPIERLPVVEQGWGRRLLGSINKTDLLLTLAHGRERQAD